MDIFVSITGGLIVGLACRRWYGHKMAGKQALLVANRLLPDMQKLERACRHWQVFAKGFMPLICFLSQQMQRVIAHMEKALMSQSLRFSDISQRPATGLLGRGRLAGKCTTGGETDAV